MPSRFDQLMSATAERLLAAFGDAWTTEGGESFTAVLSTRVDEQLNDEQGQGQQRTALLEWREGDLAPPPAVDSRLTRTDRGETWYVLRPATTEAGYSGVLIAMHRHHNVGGV